MNYENIIKMTSVIKHLEDTEKDNIDYLVLYMLLTDENLVNYLKGFNTNFTENIIDYYLRGEFPYEIETLYEYFCSTSKEFLSNLIFMDELNFITVDYYEIKLCNFCEFIETFKKTDATSIVYDKSLTTLDKWGVDINFIKRRLYLR